MVRGRHTTRRFGRFGWALALVVGLFGGMVGVASTSTAAYAGTSSFTSSCPGVPIFGTVSLATTVSETPSIPSAVATGTTYTATPSVTATIPASFLNTAGLFFTSIPITNATLAVNGVGFTQASQTATQAASSTPAVPVLPSGNVDTPVTVVMNPLTWTTGSSGPASLTPAALSFKVLGLLTISCTATPPVPAMDSTTIVGPPAITTTTLPAGQVGVSYIRPVVASGGTPPLTWSISSGTLPAGLSIDATTGVISGTPTTAGTGSFTVAVTDSSSPTPITVTQALSINVLPVPPTLNSISPSHGSVKGGTPVTIIGSGFRPGDTVAFNSTAATNVVVVSPTQITAVSPPHGPASVNVTVTDGGATSGPVTFIYVIPGKPATLSAQVGPPTPATIKTGPPQAPQGHSGALPWGLAIGGVGLLGLGLEAIRRNGRRRTA